MNIAGCHKIALSVKFAALVGTFFLPATVRADRLIDLRSRLRSVSPATPLRARIEITHRELAGEGRDARATETRERIDAEVGPHGLRLALSPEQVATVQEAIRKSRLATEAPRAQLVGAVPPTVVMNLVDAAFPLLVLIESATLISDSPDPHGGPDGRILVFTLTSRLTREEAARLKEVDESVKIWLDGDGWPVASHETLRAKATKAFSRFDFEMSTKIDYGRVPGRLFATDRKESFKSVAKGFTEETTTHLRVSLVP